MWLDLTAAVMRLALSWPQSPGWLMGKWLPVISPVCRVTSEQSSHCSTVISQHHHTQLVPVLPPCVEMCRDVEMYRDVLCGGIFKTYFHPRTVDRHRHRSNAPRSAERNLKQRMFSIRAVRRGAGHYGQGQEMPSVDCSCTMGCMFTVSQQVTTILANSSVRDISRNGSESTISCFIQYKKNCFIQSEQSIVLSWRCDWMKKLTCCCAWIFSW